MPLASEEHVPKPLTYALMYHVVWALLFGASGLVVHALAGKPSTASVYSRCTWCACS